MITLRDYWMGRDTHYPTYWSPDVRANGQRTVDLVNKLLERAALFGIFPTRSDNGFGFVRSGWRPPTVNLATPNAAPNSMHLTGEAVDLNDADGEFDDWLMGAEGQRALEEIGLWMEHPAFTKTWSHVQTRPPKSGRRVFYP